MIPRFGKSKSHLQSFVTPEAYLGSVGRTEKLPVDTAILVYHPSILAIAQKQLSHFKLWKKNILTDNLLITSGIGIGAPAAVVFLEELAALGIRRVVTLGSAGALTNQDAIGTSLLIAKAVRDEGTSYHYLDADRPALASVDLTAELQKVLQAQTVTSWTTDAPYRETHQEIQHWRNSGVRVVEMEAAAVFAWAEYRGVQVASVVVVSDLLHDQEWSPHFAHQELKRGLSQSMTLLLSHFENQTTKS